MPSVREVKWSEGVDLQLGSGITEEEQRAIEARMKQLDLLLKSESRKATYKLEVMFDEERSFHRPFGGTLTLWESGNKLHGGGDTKLYICPGKELRKNGCEGLLNDTSRSRHLLVCPSCGCLWNLGEVFGEIYFRLPMEKWGDVLVSWFIKLNLDADVRLKYARDDIRTVAMKEQERNIGGELLLKARSEERRSSAIYPLRNIIKDTSAGAGLHSRFLAFLKS